MNPFEQFIENLIGETEKAILSLSNIEGDEKGKSLLLDVQNALKSNDINKLNEIIKENGDKLSTK